MPAFVCEVLAHCKVKAQFWFLFHFIWFADCFIDIAVGFDLPGWAGSENIFAGQQKLKLKLAEILQRITSVTDISCLSNSQPTISMAIYMQSKTGQIIFESKFANYSAETISNLMAIKTAEKIDLTVENLESLGKKLRERTSKAKVKLFFQKIYLLNLLWNFAWFYEL